MCPPAAPTAGSRAPGSHKTSVCRELRGVGAAPGKGRPSAAPAGQELGLSPLDCSGRGFLYRGLRPPWGCGCVEAAGGLWALQPRRAGQRGRVSWEGWDRARRCKRRLSCGRSRCQATTGISCGIGVVLPLAGCPQGWAEAGMPKDELVSRGCRWKRRERTALPARLKCGHPLLVWPAKG